MAERILGDLLIGAGAFLGGCLLIGAVAAWLVARWAREDLERDGRPRPDDHEQH